MTKRTFVGFGFGAIQAGLFLYEAQRSGKFDRLVVAYRRPEVIATIRANGGYFQVNIAHADQIEQARVGPIEIYDVNEPSERACIIDAIAEANELATALGSVNDYVSLGPSSIHSLLAKGLEKKLALELSPAVIYAAENDNHAAEKLERLLRSKLGHSLALSLGLRVQFLNTVIGKMSGLVQNKSVIEKHDLKTLTPSSHNAFLVESFSRILISRVNLGHFERGINSFEEKADLLPFEEAKLFGHNATHALAAYVATLLELSHIRDLQNVSGALPFLHDAFKSESGAALINKYEGFDPLFTEQGYTAFADDLLKRMMNPFLNDSVERVARDSKRKLGWDDRLVGTIRLALKEGVQAERFAFGVAAALEHLNQTETFEVFLKDLWQQQETQELRDVLDLIKQAIVSLENWQTQNHPDLQKFFSA